MKQISILDYMYPKYKNNKPIRLIELFAGYGSQALALKYLNIPFEHYKICEFDKTAIKTYNEIHGTIFEASDIKNIKASNLKIEETNKYTYLITYSFPCTDLSLAGKRQGMSKDSGTRSGLLWEVERILLECKDKELPQLLLMENVPQVICSDFNDWQLCLEKLGYKNYTQILNAKDYGIPQNRNRCFMVSILGDYSYSFPQPIKLDKRLKDFLEDVVDEKYYLSEKALNGLKNTQFQCSKIENRVAKGMIQTIKTQPNDIGVVVEELIPFGSYYTWKGKQGKYNTQCNRAASPEKCALTIACTEPGKVINNLRIRKLTPKECFRLMGVRDSDINKITCSNSQKYKLAGNSIVVNVLMAIFKELFD